ncbi:SDR family oxidoreductase [Tritonibacter horizontis]|uniref:Glucose 1-dehydrogenase 2 n=1 Tax=Tritonibacter horizontis TaxID=1768241 RepID=A0A132C4B7_9RHOB|nr:SDR family oxidoreductase [Tritonibacter horizontis]KUP95022.1 glucose 1-dehydrogenase 2 [Tritonibacter horizontis]
MNVADKTVVISGASRGIGADTARVFAAAGANVALLARSAEALKDLAAEIGEKALVLACDVSDYAAVEAAFDAARKRFGSLDVLICNAGLIDPIARLQDASPAAWRQLIDVNITGVFNMMHAGLPHLKAAGGGSVLTIGSGASQRPLEGWSAYCTSKAGAAMLTEALHLEEGDNGIRVMGLSPGTVATQMQRDIKASGLNPVSKLAWEDHIPADWPARTLLWMCSADADAFVGTEISLRDETIRKRVGLI